MFFFGSHGPIKEPYYHFFKGELWVSPHLTNMSQISMPYYSDSKSKHTKNIQIKKHRMGVKWP